MTVVLLQYRARVLAAAELAVTRTVAHIPPSLPLLAKRAAWALLLVYCCSVSARIFWWMVPLPGGEVATVKLQPAFGVTAAEPAGEMRQVDIAALQRLRLFGTVQTDSPVTAVAPALAVAAEETELDLLLLGVMVSPDQSAARAIISHRNSQALYAVGDKVPGGVQVQLEQVLPGRVIINNAGNYESLWLYEDRNEPSSPNHRLANRSVPPVVQSGTPGFAGRAPLATADPKVLVDKEPARHHSSPAELTTRQDAGAQDVARSLADIIKFTPVHAEGRILGYRIAPGRAGQVFSQLGLQKNDVITGVNGVPLDDPTRALKAYRQIQSSRAASFELMRDGDSHVVDVALGKSNG